MEDNISAKLENVMVKMNPVKLVKNINRIFTDDFGFPKDFVKAHLNGDGNFGLRIGWRYMELRANGEFEECGTAAVIEGQYTITEDSD